MVATAHARARSDKLLVAALLIVVSVLAVASDAPALPPTPTPQASAATGPVTVSPTPLVGLGLRPIRALSAARVAVRQHAIIRYGDAAPGFEKHHGVLDVWAQHNIHGYARRDAPAVVLTKEQHDATRAVYRKWLRARTGRAVGGRVDWKSVSPREAQALTQRMFDAAGVPQDVQRQYMRAFHQYIYNR